MENNDTKNYDAHVTYVTYVIVRKDLELSKGKWIAQVAHALMRNMIEFGATDSDLKYDSYRDDGFPLEQIATEHLPKVVVLYVKSKEALLQLAHTLRNKSIRVGLQVDGGINEVEKGTPTCLVVGPVSSAEKETIQVNMKRLQTLKE